MPASAWVAVFVLAGSLIAAAAENDTRSCVQKKLDWIDKDGVAKGNTIKNGGERQEEIFRAGQECADEGVERAHREGEAVGAKRRFEDIGKDDGGQAARDEARAKLKAEQAARAANAPQQRAQPDSTADCGAAIAKAGEELSADVAAGKQITDANEALRAKLPKQCQAFIAGPPGQQ